VVDVSGYEYKIIIGYVIFLGVLSFLATIGANQILTNPPTPPIVPPIPSADPISTLFWVAENIGYFFTLMLATSLEYPLLAVFIAGYTVVIIYIVLGLIRGGH